MDLTDDQIKQVFKEGGTILDKGKIYRSLAEIPSAYERAKGDEDRQSAILAQMEADIAAKQAEVEALKAQLKPAGSEPAEQTAAEEAAATEKANLKKHLESLNKDELLAEVQAAKITLPADVNTKSEIITFLLTQE